MKVAIVHDYLREFGGAERVLEGVCEIWPDAPIYTSFYTPGSDAYKRLKDRGIRDIRVSWAHDIPFFASKLHSPLRFLAPFIWGSFSDELSKYDVVISSASWYITKGFGRRNKGNGAMPAGRQGDKGRPIEFCYCHTPPRWLYGYKTSIEFQKYWPFKLYAKVVGYFMKKYDFAAAQRVDYFIANSKEVQSRIKKFYHRDSVVIYPPVELPTTDYSLQTTAKKSAVDRRPKTVDSYYLTVSRIVGGKGLELAVKAAVKKGFKLKIVGASAGYGTEFGKLTSIAKKNVEFLGFVSDEELVQLYSGAKGFLALSQDEDFGITPLEAMLCGTPVVAFNGGGYKESVLQGRTGVFFQEYSVEGLIAAIDKFEKTKFSGSDIIKHAKRFSKERFKKEIKDFVERNYLEK